ncbi:MAG: hypothetical protein K0B37_18315, partial [Bacteroidales bacterium]|nr:hypothetical protein [Bacteroidales bacterium]
LFRFRARAVVVPKKSPRDFQNCVPAPLREKKKFEKIRVICGPIRASVAKKIPENSRNQWTHPCIRGKKIPIL